MSDSAESLQTSAEINPRPKARGVICDLSVIASVADGVNEGGLTLFHLFEGAL
jgi:hypothetical protein